MVEWTTSSSDSGLEFSSATFPNFAVKPGGSIPVEATVLNKNEFIFNDPDAADNPDSPCIDELGYCVEVYFALLDQVVMDRDSINTSIDTQSKIYSGDLIAPQQEASYEIVAQGYLPGSDQHSRPISGSVTVTSDTSQLPDNGDGGGGGNGGGGGDLTQWVINNPVKAGALGIAGTVVLKTATETATEETFE